MILIHLHTEYCLLESTIKLTHLVAKARSIGMNARAITDSGSMLGAANFYFAVREQGIKPITGSARIILELN